MPKEYHLKATLSSGLRWQWAPKISYTLLKGYRWAKLRWGAMRLSIVLTTSVS